VGDEQRAAQTIPRQVAERKIVNVVGPGTDVMQPCPGFHILCTVGPRGEAGCGREVDARVLGPALPRAATGRRKRMKTGASVLPPVAVLVGALLLHSGPAPGETYLVTVSGSRSGPAGAVVRTAVRIRNEAATAVTVEATLYDRSDGTSIRSGPFSIGAGKEVSSDNALQSLFGKAPGDRPCGPIRFDASGPVLVSTGFHDAGAPAARAGRTRWSPAIAASRPLPAGAIGRLDRGAGAAGRAGVAFMNPGQTAATARVVVRRTGGQPVALRRIGPVPPNGLAEVELDGLAEAAGPGDTGAWLEFSSTGPLLAYRTVTREEPSDSGAEIAGRETLPVSLGEISFTLPGGVQLVLVRIPAGTFQMGSPASERGRDPDEGPRHPVTVVDDFYLGKFEVTQAQWRSVMGLLPASGHGAGDDFPVYYVTWDDIAGPGGFLEKVNAALGSARLRLPSEAEWEYAARAGTTTPFSFGDDPSCPMSTCGECVLFNTYMWCSGSLTGYGSRPVGQKAANPWGLFDIHGNVWEWVQDCFHPTYAGAPADGRAWAEAGCTDRVLRGGHWHGPADACRSANRSHETASFYRVVNGFRLAITAGPAHRLRRRVHPAT
jgi:formylglycine-generating enzyme required for sulfatase activity